MYERTVGSRIMEALIHKMDNPSFCGNCRGVVVTLTLSRLYGNILRDVIEKENKDWEPE